MGEQTRLKRFIKIYEVLHLSTWARTSTWKHFIHRRLSSRSWNQDWKQEAFTLRKDFFFSSSKSEEKSCNNFLNWKARRRTKSNYAMLMLDLRKNLQYFTKISKISYFPTGQKLLNHFSVEIISVWFFVILKVQDDAIWSRSFQENQCNWPIWS